LSRVTFAIRLLALPTVVCVAAAGCGCTCSPPRLYAPSSGSPAAVVAPASRGGGSAAERTPSFYDRYREERHRREVEKQLRDIKRNTNRAKGEKL